MAGRKLWQRTKLIAGFSIFLILMLLAGLVTRKVIILNGLSGRVMVKDKMKYREAVLGQSADSTWPLLLVNFSEKIPNRSKLLLWKLADASDSGSVIFGCNWDTGILGGRIWILNYYLDAKKFASGSYKDGANAELNKIILYCAKKIEYKPGTEAQAEEFSNSFVQYFEGLERNYPIQFKL